MDTYDFDQALTLPVVGSSVFGRAGGAVHWLPVPKTEEFQPLHRAAGWTGAQHERFNWIAGTELMTLGYSPKVFSGQALRWRLWNLMCDGRHEMKATSLRRRLRYRRAP